MLPYRQRIGSAPAHIGPTELQFRELRIPFAACANICAAPAKLVCASSAQAAENNWTNLLAAVSNADLVILCTPLAQMRSAVVEMLFLPALKRGAIVTDVGSVKAGVVRELEPLVFKSGAHFVGSHPMAGGEKTGVNWRRAPICLRTPFA